METTQGYYSTFQAARADITSRLDNNENANEELVRRLSDDIQSIRKTLNDATPFLPTYDRRTCENQLQELEAKVDALRSKITPKSRFAFKKTSGSATASAISTPEPRSDQVRTVPVAQITTPNISLDSKSYQYFTPASFSLPGLEMMGSQTVSTALIISTLDHCVVDLLPRSRSSSWNGVPETQGERADGSENRPGDDDPELDLTAVHIHNIKNSLVLVGRVRGSVLVHDLEQCTIVVACHQLRVHSSHDTRFHLHVASNAVIEDCAGLSFAGYPLALPLPPDVHTQKSTHHYVQDFSHLKSTPSPHWIAIADPSTESDAADDAVRWSNTMSALSAISQLSAADSEGRRAHLEVVLSKTLPVIG